MGRGGEGFGLSSEDTGFFHGRRKAELGFQAPASVGRRGVWSPCGFCSDPACLLREIRSN